MGAAEVRTFDSTSSRTTRGRAFRAPPRGRSADLRCRWLSSPHPCPLSLPWAQCRSGWGRGSFVEEGHLNQAWTVWKQPQGQRGRGVGSGGGHVGSQGLGYGERAGTPRAVQSGAQEHLPRGGHLAWACFAPLGCGGGCVVRGGDRGRRVSEASGAPSPRREACLRPHLGSLSLLPGPRWRPSQWALSSLGVTVPQGRPGPGGRSPGEGHLPRTEALPAGRSAQLARAVASTHLCHLFACCS